jgi:uncharacterized protein YecA (UPF0149 family)
MSDDVLDHKPLPAPAAGRQAHGHQHQADDDACGCGHDHHHHGHHHHHAPVATVRRDGPKIGRNDPCPCGSGRKYKKCCLSG